MRKLIKGLAFGSCMVLASVGSTQVQYKLDWKPQEGAFQVSLVPQTNWTGPQALTASGQITIKAPTGTLDIMNVKNLVNDVKWEFNARHNAPPEAEGYDYFSFGLASMGTSKIPYNAGIEVPIFTFQNGSDCDITVALVNNETDPFLPPNSFKANIANQLTVLGASGNAYSGNVDIGEAICGLASAVVEASAFTSISIYPTNVSSIVNVTLDAKRNDANALFRMVDQSGRIVTSQRHALSSGKNIVHLDVSTLRSGSYSIELKSDKSTIVMGRFFKTIE